MVRGYHAYQDNWDALIGEEPNVCTREPDNLRDPFAVAVVKSDAAPALGGELFGERSMWIRQLAPRILCILTYMSVADLGVVRWVRTNHPSSG